MAKRYFHGHKAILLVHNNIKCVYERCMRIYVYLYTYLCTVYVLQYLVYIESPIIPAPWFGCRNNIISNARNGAFFPCSIFIFCINVNVYEVHSLANAHMLLQWLCFYRKSLCEDGLSERREIVLYNYGHGMAMFLYCTHV